MMRTPADTARRTGLLALAGFLLCGQAARAAAEMEPFTRDDRVVVFAPHPDDETIGCGGVIQQVLAAGGRAFVVFLTNGDHNQVAFKLYEKRIVLRPRDYIAMGELRRAEALEAAHALGVPRENLFFLGYPDGGTLKIWKEHWGAAPSYVNFLTRANRVPYPENLSYQAPYKGESILRDIETLLRRIRPTRVFVPHPADTNFDHRALYAFCVAALLDVGGTGPLPRIFPYLVHLGRWPVPPGYRPGTAAEPPGRLRDADIAWSSVNLAPEQTAAKRRAQLCYRSQKVARGSWLASFCRRNEIFGDYRVLPLNGPAAAADCVVIEGLGEGDLPGAAGPRGVSAISVSRRDETLRLRVRFRTLVEEEVGLTLYLFGYSRAVAFPAMPKISVRLLHPDRILVADGRVPVRGGGGVTMAWRGRKASFAVPLALLRDPDLVFTAVESYVGEFPVDLTAWRIVELRRPGARR